MKRTVKGSILMMLAIIMVCQVFIVNAFAENTKTTYSVNVVYGQKEARNVLTYINAKRTGLNEMIYDYELEKVAMQRAVEAAIKFSRMRPDGTPYTSLYTGSYATKAGFETIVAGATMAEKVVEAAMSNDTEKGYLLDPANQRVAVGHVIIEGWDYWAIEYSQYLGSSKLTDPVNTARMVKVDVLDKYLKARTVVPQNTVYTLNPKESLKLADEVTSFIQVDEASETEKRPKTCPVVAGYKCRISDQTVVDYTDGMLVAKKSGTATVTVTDTYGSTCSFTIKVKYNSDVCPHTDTTVVKKGKLATFTSDGKTPTLKCNDCGKTIEGGKKIYRISEVRLDTYSCTYTGKPIIPKLKLYDSKGNIVSDDHYTVTYPVGCKNVGIYGITIDLVGNYYKGTQDMNFTIYPKPVAIKKLVGGKNRLTVKWKKIKNQADGYDIQYSLKKNFSDAKLQTVKGVGTLTKTYKKLKSKKTYYVRLRTYKTVKIDGADRKLVSAWSAVKTVKTK